MYPQTAAMMMPTITIYTKVPIITGQMPAAMAVPELKYHRSAAVGTSRARMVPPTTPMGRSRSVSSNTVPAWRALEAAMAERMPLMIGPMMRKRLHSAATPIVPAPMKRTSILKVVLTSWSRSPVTPCRCVRKGTNPTQAMSMPTNIAIPTESPTR